MCLHAQAARGPCSLHDEEDVLEPMGQKGTTGRKGRGSLWSPE